MTLFYKCDGICSKRKFKYEEKYETQLARYLIQFGISLGFMGQIIFPVPTVISVEPPHYTGMGANYK